MRTDRFFDSLGEGKIHYCLWHPEGKPKAVVQILHGIADYAMRYEPFAQYLNQQGFLVVAEDHMGHGQSVSDGGTVGYFAGGWFTAVEDSCQLLKLVKQQWPELPYVLFGHSMGSFMARTILAKYPDIGLSAAVICGTGWMPRSVLQAGFTACSLACKVYGERVPNETLQKMVFGSYNRKVEHPRTAYDWISRDGRIVDAYVADPMCGFTASAGLMREMLRGMLYIQQPGSLQKMNKNLPIYLIAGGDDPVGDYGKGVQKTASAFRNAGVEDVSVRIYPLCRHEILNEINRQEVFSHTAQWIESKI